MPAANLSSHLAPPFCATEKGAKAALAAKDRTSDDGIKNWEDDLSSKKPLAAAPAEDPKDLKPAKARGGVSGWAALMPSVSYAWADACTDARGGVGLWLLQSDACTDAVLGGLDWLGQRYARLQPCSGHC